MEEKRIEGGFALSAELWKRREEREAEGISELKRNNRSNYIVGNSETLLTLEVTILAKEIHTSITRPQVYCCQVVSVYVVRQECLHIFYAQRVMHNRSGWLILCETNKLFLCKH